MQAPAMATFQEKIYLAWLEMGTTTISLISSADGMNFSEKVTVHEGSTLAPALATFQDRLYIATTNGNPSDITIASSTDGKTFTDQITICEPTSAPLP